MRTCVSVAVILLASWCLSCPAYSQVYRWKDKDGVLHITSTPPPPGAKWEMKKVQEVPQRATGAADAGPDVKTAAGQRPNSEIKVILYETDWCPYCRKAGEYLKSLGVNLVRYDIEKNPEKGQEKMRKAPGYTGVPLIDVEGILIRGYGQEQIKDAVEKKRLQ